MRKTFKELHRKRSSGQRTRILAMERLESRTYLASDLATSSSDWLDVTKIGDPIPLSCENPIALCAIVPPGTVVFDRLESSVPEPPIHNNEPSMEWTLPRHQLPDVDSHYDGSPMVDLSLTATTADGAPLEELHVGDDFILHVWAQDIRTDPHGVFAAYLNLDWDSVLASTAGQPEYGDHFSNGISGSGDAPGVIHNIGGFGGPTETMGSRLEVFSLTMHATAAGDLTIYSSPSGRTPQCNILEYGIDTAIDPRAVQFGSLPIHIADAESSQTPHEPTNVPVTEPPGTPPSTETPGVNLFVSATTPAGGPITDLHAGESFIVHVWVQDSRLQPQGVYSVYLSLDWDGELASLAGSISHGEHFSDGHSDGDSVAGSLNRVGGFGGRRDTHGNRYEVLSIPMQAIAAGELSISTSSAMNGTPEFWILEFGMDGAVPINNIQFGTLSLDIADALPVEQPTLAFDLPISDGSTSLENEILAIRPTPTPTLMASPPPASVSGSADALQPNDRTSDTGAIVFEQDQNPLPDAACTDLESAAKLELSLL